MTPYRARKLWLAFTSRIRTLVYRAVGMKITGRVWLDAIEWPLRPACITLGEGAALDRSAVLLATNDDARITLGRHCYVNRHTIFDASLSVEIGDDTMIGPFCYITDHDHGFGPGIAPGAAPLISQPTRIGQRCWLGAHVTVLKGVTIGDGTVVAAGSVVTKSLPANVVAAGVPARVIRDIAD